MRSFGTFNTWIVCLVKLRKLFVKHNNRIAEIHIAINVKTRARARERKKWRKKKMRIEQLHRLPLRIELYFFVAVYKYMCHVRALYIPLSETISCWLFYLYPWMRIVFYDRITFIILSWIAFASIFKIFSFTSFTSTSTSM